MKKLRERQGETLVETLCAMLVVTVVMLCLSTAVVSAARVNAQVKNRDVSYRAENMKYAGTVSVTVSDDNTSCQYTLGQYVGNGEDNTASYRCYGALPTNGGN